MSDNSNTDSHGDRNGNTHCDFNSYGHSNRNADCDANGYGHSNSNAYSDCNCNSNRHAYLNVHSHTDGDARWMRSRARLLEKPCAVAGESVATWQPHVQPAGVAVHSTTTSPG